MEIAHIYIYGDIGWWQASDAADWGEITLTDVRNQYEAQKDAEEIHMHIHSPGGYVTEGFAIHDYIRSLGKPVTTIIEGMCYSIATVIALAGDTRKMTSNSDFMVHNPWGGAMGDSEEVQKYADDLKKLEQKVADFYAAKTNITSDEALELMKAETFMTPEEALEKGFITEIATVMKAVAKFNPKSNKMSDKALTKDEAEGLFKNWEKKFKSFFKPKALKVVQDANANDIEFPDLEEDDTPSVGDKATIDGSPAEGEHVMPSGETYVFTGGELTEIKPDEEEEGGDTSEEMQQLQDEVKSLKSEAKNREKKFKALQKKNKELEDTISDSNKMLKDMRADMKALNKSFKSGFSHDGGDGNDGKGKGKGEQTRQLFKKEKE